VRKLIWAFGWTGVAIWSLVSALAYWVVSAAGFVAMRNADVLSADPETVELLFNLFGWMRGFSTSVVLVVWGIVSLAILAVPWLLDRAIGRTPAPPPAAFGQGRPGRDVIDLPPSDYTVGAPRQAGRSAGVPRIGPNG
jgi:hypothetical protein